MTEPTTSERLEDVYDEIVNVLTDLVSEVATITEVKRGFPRLAISTFSTPSAYIYYTGTDPAPEQDYWGPARLKHNLALSVFLVNERQIIDFIGKYEDSNLCDSNILSGLYRIDFRNASRIQGRDLPISADYGVTINISVIL